MGKESEPAAEIFDSSTLIDFLYVERLDEAPDITSIEGFTDMVSSAMNTLYTASKYKLIPLLIFRGIRY